MPRQIALIFLIVTLIIRVSLAGNTGKIVGLVTDKNSGEPLIGVNVVLKNTTLGASTDANGEYYIINIHPGKYSVECSYIGYQTMEVENVLIQSDQTTMLNFQLSEQTMELDEKIIVVAERPLVQRDLTSSKKITTTEEIQAMPVESYAGIMLTHAGVTKGAGGELHIRGGRSTEIAYLVDGISVANPFTTNGMATSVANNSIQEMTLVSGAFNAEYGNAMSGVVNFTTKDGTPDFKTYLSFYSGDYISGHENIYTNINDVNPTANYNFEGTLSGPLSFLGIDGRSNNFFISVRRSISEGYLYGIREHLTTDSANFELKQYITVEKDEDKFITTIEYRDEWYIENKGDKAFVPMNPSEGLNLLGKVKFQVLPGMSLRLQSIHESSWRKSYAHTYKYVPDGTYQYNSSSFNNSLRLTHTLSNSTFYELRLAFNTRDYKKYTFEDVNDPRYAPTDKIQGNPGGTTFNFGGAQRDHNYEKSRTYLGKFDIISQVNKKHLVKGGFEARMNVLDREYFSIGFDRNLYSQPTPVNRGIYVRYPTQMSVYLQDKLEYTDMIINAGLRYDYFNSDAMYTVDELQPDGQRKQAEAKQMLAPRLGISFPITEKGIIHLSYGHFYQMPALTNLYTNPFFYLPVTGTPLFGNSNLNPEKQITYEIGLQQQFTDEFAIDVTGFYKDIRNLLAWQTIMFTRLNLDTGDRGDRQEYRIRRNQDYANIKGVTVSFEKRMTSGSPVAAKIDYTFQITEGNDNDPASFYYNSLSGQETIKEIVPLDWDQTHNLYASLTVVPLKGMSVSMIGRLSSGYPYTAQLTNTNYDSDPNSSNKPLQKGVDFRISYRFEFAGMYPQVFVKVYNLFDNLNERYVFDDTGRAEYTFANRGINEPDSFKKHYGEPGVHTYDEYNVRPHYYGSPRNVRIGVSIEF